MKYIGIIETKINSLCKIKCIKCIFLKNKYYFNYTYIKYLYSIDYRNECKLNDIIYIQTFTNKYNYKYNTFILTKIL